MRESDGFAQVCLVRMIGSVWVGHSQDGDARSQNIHRMRFGRYIVEHLLHGFG